MLRPFFIIDTLQACFESFHIRMPRFRQMLHIILDGGATSRIPPFLQHSSYPAELRVSGQSSLSADISHSSNPYGVPDTADAAGSL
ncbi:hypothetical protein K474DRAFT_492723 [Panus rudis PR-1116 ss-1]|nr:hypothetical protein K474DRAFT_492723 [Panus rudis PR-1116 ss-1]